MAPGRVTSPELGICKKRKWKRLQALKPEQVMWNTRCAWFNFSPGKNQLRFVQHNARISKRNELLKWKCDTLRPSTILVRWWLFTFLFQMLKGILTKLKFQVCYVDSWRDRWTAIAMVKVCPILYADHGAWGTPGHSNDLNWLSSDHYLWAKRSATLREGMDVHIKKYSVIGAKRQWSDIFVASGPILDSYRN